MRHKQNTAPIAFLMPCVCMLQILRFRVYVLVVITDYSSLLWLLQFLYPLVVVDNVIRKVYQELG